MAFFSETPERQIQMQRFGPEQQQAMSSMLSQALQMLQGGGAGQENLQQFLQQQPGAGFEPIAQQRRQEFQEQTLPTLQEKLTAMTGGGQPSTGAQQILAQAGRGLESDLAAEQAKFAQTERGQQLQGIGMQQDLIKNLSQLGMQQPYENIFQPRQPSTLEQAGGQAIGNLPLLLKVLLGGGSGLGFGGSNIGGGGNTNIGGYGNTGQGTTT